MMDFDEEEGGDNLRAQSCPCIFLLNVSPAILQQKD